jgi:hypothetical protein
MRPVEPLNPKHPTCLAVLGLATDLEACLRELSQIPSSPGSRPPDFHQLIEEHKDKPTFSDYWGVYSARIVRNRISHREPRPGAQPLSLRASVQGQRIRWNRRSLAGQTRSRDAVQGGMAVN